MILALLGLFVAVLVVYYILIVYQTRKKYEKIPGPPTKGIMGFFTGNVKMMAEDDAKGTFSTKTMTEL